MGSLPGVRHWIEGCRKHLTARHAADPEGYRLLVASLFSSPASIIPGGIAATLTPYICWHVTGDMVFAELTVVIAIIAALRTVTLFRYRWHDTKSDTIEQTRRWDREFFAGATVLSIALGVTCLIALVSTDHPAAHLAAVTATIAFSSGFVARNAGRPAFVAIQLFCFCVPMTTGLFLAPDGIYHAIGYFSFLFVASSLSITYSGHANLVALGQATKRAQRLAIEVQSKNDTLDAALSNMTHGLAMFDKDLRLRVSNGKFPDFLGLERDLWVANPHLDEMNAILASRALMSDPHRRSLARACDDVQITGQAVTLEIACNGRQLTASIANVRGGGLVLVLEDTTTRHAAEAEIRRMASYDELTGVANRFTFGLSLKEAFASLQIGQSFSVFYIDLDNFKQINDSLGHEAGDLVLIEAARRLSGLLGPNDSLARFGGDEFVLIHRSGHQRDVDAFAERITAAMAPPISASGIEVFAPASVGVAVAPEHGASPTDIIRHADLALYEAKKNGRNGTCMFSPDMAEAVSERQYLETKLRQAIDASVLELHYQPILDMKTKRVVACEALMRWPHPDRGMISPGVFIPIAEQAGLIRRMGKWAIRQACFDAAEWPIEVSVAVNVSPTQFRAPAELIQAVSDALAASNLAPQRLSLEVTESLLIENRDVALEAIRELRRMGVKLSLDDFGSGYSSLAYLSSFPFSQVKIDGSFIRDITTNHHSRAIVEAVCHLSRRLGMQVVVEGVETEEQLDVIEKIGADRTQGFLLGRPQPVNMIRQVVGRRRARAPLSLIA